MMLYFLGIILGLLPTYLIRFKILGLPTTVLEIMVMVFLFVALSQINRDSIERIKKLGWLNLVTVLFLLAGIISTLVSPDKIHALGELKAFIIEPILFFYALILTIKTEDDLKPVLRWLFMAAGLIALFGIVQYFTYLHLPLRFWGTGSEVERITSVFDYPNALALYLAPLFGFYIVLWAKKYNLFNRTWILPVGLLIMLGAIILTFSRGAWLAIALTLILLFFKQFSWKKWIGPVLITIVLLLFLKPVSDRVKLGLADPSSLAHFELQKVGWQKVWQSPVLGNGLHGFQALGVSYPHNIFLNFWLELGLLGLVSFAGIICLVFQQYKIRPSALTLASGVFMMILILHGLVDVPYFKNDLSILFWFVAAVAYV